MTQRIILFNGPPGSGKDTAARICMQAEDLNGYPRVFDRMSMPLKKAFADIFGENIDRWGNVGFYEDRKEEKVQDLDVSFRQWQIDFSERFMKPLFGQDIFGKLFISRSKRQSKDAVIFVPDCGFDIEYKTLVDYYGSNNVLVIKIYRPDYTFKSDSRNYLKVGSFGTKCDTEHVRHINNATTQQDYERKILKAVTQWLEKKQ